MNITPTAPIAPLPIQPIDFMPLPGPDDVPQNGNGGIVPPWLQVDTDE